MNNGYTCPNCHSKQKVKHIFFYTKNSRWNCHKCNAVLKPNEESTHIAVIAIFSSIIGTAPGIYSLHVLKNDLSTSLLIGLFFGVIGYSLLIVFNYFRLDLKIEE